MSDYWTENNLVKPQQIVVCAACMFGDILVTGARHHDKVMNDVLCKLEDNGVKLDGECKQGFIDQFGEFLTREEALKIVKKNNQPFDIERNGSDNSLFSEGLY